MLRITSCAGKPSNIDIKKQCCGETATHMAETFSFQGKDGASQVMFFSSVVADIALRLGPNIGISEKTN